MLNDFNFVHTDKIFKMMTKEVLNLIVGINKIIWIQRRWKKGTCARYICMHVYVYMHTYIYIVARLYDVFIRIFIVWSTRLHSDRECESPLLEFCIVLYYYLYALKKYSQTIIIWGVKKWCIPMFLFYRNGTFTR